MASVHPRNHVAWPAVALGCWLWCAPFVLGYPRYHPFLRATASDLAVGTVVVTLGLLGAWRGDRAQGALRGLVLCALWLLAADPVLGLRGGPLVRAAVNDPVTGTVLLVVALLALLTAGRAAPPRSAPSTQRTQPVLWARPVPGLPPAAFRGQEADGAEEKARRSIGWAYAAVAVLVVAAAALGLAFVLHSLVLLAVGLLLGLAGATTAVKVHVLADTTVGQSPRGA